jgi:hypothetical protein
MKTQLLALLALTVGLQGVAAAASPVDAEAMFQRVPLLAETKDETWGIGRRVAQSEPSWSAAAEADAGATVVADLEAAFWVCDYIATTRGVEATPIAICGAVYDELKAAKFAGDFGELLAWWKQNKVVEHLKIASEQPEATVGRIDIRY